MVGIYKITNPKGKVYVGQTVDVERRFKEYQVRQGKGQVILERSFKKYGIENHTFEVIEECLVEHLNDRERYWQDYYNVLVRGLNCRLTKTDDMSGRLSEEMKGRISKGNKGKSKSEEHRKKMSAAVRKPYKPRTGTKVLSEEHKRKLSEAKKGKPRLPFTEEHIRKLVASRQRTLELKKMI